jgi:hypothetical protein
MPFWSGISTDKVNGSQMRAAIFHINKLLRQTLNLFGKTLTEGFRRI